MNAAYNQTFNSFCFPPSQPATLLCNNDALERTPGGGGGVERGLVVVGRGGGCLRKIQQNTETLSADVCISGSEDGSAGDGRMNC